MIVEAIVDADGSVRETRVVRSVPELDEAAVEAVRQWVFAPASSDGEPIRMRLTVTVQFNIEGSP